MWLGISLVTAWVWAQDAVTLKVVKTGQVGTSNPALQVELHLDATQLDVNFSCGDKSFRHSGAAALGSTVDIPLPLPAGNYTCKGSLSGSFSDGSEGSMPLSFGVRMFPPLGVALDPGSLDLTARKLAVVLDRPASKVELTISGLGGEVLGFGEVTTSAAPGSPIGVSWEQKAGEVLKIRARAFDADGYWSELELSPWSYAIPHEDVVFASNDASIAPGEEPKLAAALVKVKETQARYGGEVVIKLYVGGYTDTVGDAAFNQELSLRRALVIARWFKDHGFDGEIHYQGFGETNPAVATGDQVDEPRNRRVEYVLAAQAPSRGRAWLPLK